MSNSHQYSMYWCCDSYFLGGFYLTPVRAVDLPVQEQQKLWCWTIVTNLYSVVCWFASNYKLWSFITQVKSNLKVQCSSNPVYISMQMKSLFISPIICTKLWLFHYWILIYQKPECIWKFVWWKMILHNCIMTLKTTAFNLIALH